MAAARKPLCAYRAPQYWPAWVGLGLLRLICLLPYRVSLGIGRWIGRLARHLPGSRDDVAKRNIELCFPDTNPQEHERITRRHFESLGMALIEAGLGRWGSDRLHREIGRLEGIEHLETAVADGKGVILLSAHFTTLEIMGRLLAQQSPPFDAVYRRNRSDFVTEIQRSGREVSAADSIEKRDIKKMVRSLRRGRPVWYAPDQSYDRKGSIVVEFFGVPTMHTTATSTLARLGRAVTLPFFPRRLDGGRYVFTIYPPLENFPSGDDARDTQQYIRVLEEHIRLCPEQYFWVHRKFKNLPDGYPDYYADFGIERPASK